MRWPQMTVLDSALLAGASHRSVHSNMTRLAKPNHKKRLGVVGMMRLGFLTPASKARLGHQVSAFYGARNRLLGFRSCRELRPIPPPLLSRRQTAFPLWITSTTLISGSSGDAGRAGQRAVPATSTSQGLFGRFNQRATGFTGCHGIWDGCHARLYHAATIHAASADGILAWR